MTFSAEKTLRDIAVLLAGDDAGGQSSAEHALAVIRTAVANASGGGSAKTLADLTDVALASPQNGDDLTYDQATSKWKNAQPSGGERVIYSHTCDGQEIALTIPFPATGTHAMIRLLVNVPVGLLGFFLGAQPTDQWQTVDFNPAGQWFSRLVLDWFRVATTGWQTSGHGNGGISEGTLFSTNGQPLTAFDLNPYDEGTGDPMPFPAGTLVEVAVR